MVELFGGSNLDWGESEGAFKRKNSGSETICVIVSLLCYANFRKLLQTLQQQWWSSGGTAWRVKSGLRREWRSFQEEELEIRKILRDCLVVFVMLTWANCCKRYNNNDEVGVELVGGLNLDWGESGGAFKRKNSGSETICVIVSLFLLC